MQTSTNKHTSIYDGKTPIDDLHLSIDEYHRLMERIASGNTHFKLCITLPDQEKVGQTIQ